MKRIIFLSAFAVLSLLQTGIFAQCPPSKEKGIHVVQPKETLYAISRKYKVTVDQLCQWNGITQNDILPMCARLRVSGTAPKQPPVVTTPTPSGNFTIPANTSHIVKEGETMASIAAVYGFTEARLRAMNRMSATDKPYVGEALAVSLCPEMEGPLASYSQESGAISTGSGTYEKVIHIASYGETITGIAAIYGMSPKEVAGMNDLALGAQLRDGQRLTVEDRRPKSAPAKQAAETKPAAKSEVPVSYEAKITVPEPTPKAAPAEAEPKPNYLSTEENDMVREINLVRSNPAAYVQYVEEYLRNNNLGQRTETAARELTDELKKTAALPKLEPLECLFTAAKKHGEENRKRGENDHQGSDGSWPWDRVRRECPNLTDGNENLVGGPASVRDAVILLLIDENISNRMHRRTLLDSKWRFIACYKIGQVGKMANSWVQQFGY